MITLNTHSDTIIFPLEMQRNIFRGPLVQSSDEKKFMLSGIKQTSTFSQTGCNIRFYPTVKWFDKEHVSILVLHKLFSDNCLVLMSSVLLCLTQFQYNDVHSEKIPIIDRNENFMTIAGVRIDENETRRAKIEDILSKLRFNFEYWIETPDAKKVEGMYQRMLLQHM